ncbi:hypothetical protein NPIL_574791 [Nephila pilipes]|uniref:Uncharacterized protein n=1 Tax=Nephila pilipes TaxID=299642 RepID=A0A8X6PNY6_NEPPI|nr:hypothetical protein NPIL_574791 [Nephila pilipes]
MSMGAAKHTSRTSLTNFAAEEQTKKINPVPLSQQRIPHQQGLPVPQRQEVARRPLVAFHRSHLHLVLLQVSHFRLQLFSDLGIRSGVDCVKPYRTRPFPVPHGLTRG